MKDTDSAHKYEMDETAALEKMIQQVEGNLQATLVKFDAGFLNCLRMLYIMLSLCVMF